MKKSSSILLAVAMSSAVAIGAVIGVNKGTIKPYLAEATVHTMTLNGDTETNLTSSYGNDLFAVETGVGTNNFVNWEVKYGKSLNNGLVSLGKSLHGNADANNYYIGNTKPITSITNITVNIGSEQKLILFGSNNKTTYYKIDFLTHENNTSSLASKYQYLRLVNGSQDVDDVDISSIVINYSCEIDDYTDEVSDITSNTVLSKPDGVVSYDTESFVDDGDGLGMTSKRSMRITKEDSADSGSIFISLGGFSLPYSEWINCQLELYINGENNASQGEKAYFYVRVYPATNTTRNSAAAYYQVRTNNGTAGWNKSVIDLGQTSSGTLSDSETYNSIIIRIQYINGYVGLDQMRISYKSTYPTYTPVIDNDDMAIASNVVNPPYKNGNIYSASDDVDITYNDGILSNSKSSVKFIANNTASYSTMSIAFDSTYDIVDDASMSIEIYVYFGGAKGTIATEANSLRINLGHTDGNTVYLSETRKDSHTTGLSNLGNNWYKYTYSVSDFGATLVNKKSNVTTFSYLYMQLHTSGVTEEDIAAGYYVVFDRLSIK